MKRTLSSLALLLLFGTAVHAADTAPVAVTQQAVAGGDISAEQIVRETLMRHELFPYVYEEQTLVLMDHDKQRDVRRIRRYSRLEDDGTFRSLLEFTHPESISGTALLFVRSAEDRRSSRIFLPALGARMTDYLGAIAGGQMLGSEFSIEDLLPEDMSSFHYSRDEDLVDDGYAYFVVRASLKPETSAAQASYSRRRLYIRQDNFFVSRIDYFGSKGRLLKRQTRHDIHRIGGKMWRADMITVENLLNRHRSILKIDRRVYSRDYVPLSVFSEERLLAAAAPAPQAEVEEQASPEPPADAGKGEAQP